MKKIILVSIVLLVGCSTSVIPAIDLYNPKTGRHVSCGPYESWGSEGYHYNALMMQRACVRDYQQAGYQRI